jgi:translocator protein
MNNTIKLIIAIAIPLAIGAIGSYFTIAEINGWYTTIQKPSFNPPNGVFGPVWTILYILLGIALFLVWKSTAAASIKQYAIALFIIQLLANFFWSILFFNQHQIGWALVDIVFLWLSILFTIFAFAKINTLSAWLLVPYISWVSFAMILNYSIWVLNK